MGRGASGRGILPATVPFMAGQPPAALAHQVLSMTPQPEAWALWAHRDSDRVRHRRRPATTGGGSAKGAMLRP